ncbi:MAG: hypothetical protein ACLTMP_07360 [Eggerthella lenta]
MAAALRSHAAAIVRRTAATWTRRAGRLKEASSTASCSTIPRRSHGSRARTRRSSRPVGAVRQKHVESGIELARERASGVVAVVYEARPNVTAVRRLPKSGNAAVLRSGSMAAATNEVIARVLHEAAWRRACPAAASAPSRGRPQADGSCSCTLVDDAHTARRSVSSATAWGVEGAGHQTGTGNCHVYVHEAPTTIRRAPSS